MKAMCVCERRVGNRAQNIGGLLCLVIGLALVPVQAAYVTDIVIDGNFDDWDDVPILATSGVTGTPIDFATLQVANDRDFLYVRFTLHNPANPQDGNGTFLHIDIDNDPSTGFNLYGMGIIGSEAAWQNDFPFEQAAGVWNTGGGLSGATYAAAPYSAVADSVELSIPRSATLTVSGDPIFPPAGESIGIMIRAEEGGGDYIWGVYQMRSQAIPEPATGLLVGVGLMIFLWRRGINRKL